jgi:hypothetical protein
MMDLRAAFPCSWSNPLEGSNQYSVSSDPSGLFFISYTGGGGTEATIDVRFYEFGYGVDAWFNIVAPDGCRLLASSNNSVTMSADTGYSDDPAQLWQTIDPTTGYEAWMSCGFTFKLFNKKYKTFLTAFMNNDYNIGLYVGNDGPDQYWSWLDWEGTGHLVAYLLNNNCQCTLMALDGFVGLELFNLGLQKWTYGG